MQTGRLGRLQVLNTIPVCAGDVINLQGDFFMRMSPMRKPVEIPAYVDLFAFFAPHRWYSPVVDTAAAGVYSKENAFAAAVRDPSGNIDIATHPTITALTADHRALAASVDNLEPFHAVGQGFNFFNPQILSMYQSIWRAYFRDWRSDTQQDTATEAARAR